MSDYDYRFSSTVYDPANNPICKIAACVLVGWGAYMFIQNGNKNKQTPERRKHRQGLTMSSIDKNIDKKNRSSGKKVPANIKVPFYSRHNYNRRRRPTMQS